MKIFSYLIFFIFNFIFPADVGLACCEAGSRDDIKGLGYVGYKGFSFCPETRQFSGEFWDDVDSMKMKLEKALNLYCLITTMELNRARQGPFSAKVIARNEESSQSLVLSFVASEEGKSEEDEEYSQFSAPGFVASEKGRSEEVSQSSVSSFVVSEEAKIEEDEEDEEARLEIRRLETKKKAQEKTLRHIKKMKQGLNDLFYLLALDPGLVVIRLPKEPILAPNFDDLINRIGEDFLKDINIGDFKAETSYLMRFFSLSFSHLARIEEMGNESFMNLAEKLHDFYLKLILEIEKFQSEIRQNKDKQAKPTRCVIL